MASNELRGISSSLRALEAGVNELKGQSPVNDPKSPVQGEQDFVLLVPECKTSGSYEIAQKISSLLIVVQNLKTEEKKPRGSVTVRFVLHIQDQSFLIASQVILKDGSFVLPIPTCGSNSTIELEFEGTADVLIWGI